MAAHSSNESHSNQKLRHKPLVVEIKKIADFYILPRAATNGVIRACLRKNISPSFNEIT